MRKFVAAALALIILCACTQKDTVEDPYLWLEDVGGEQALAWVEEQNEVSLAYLEALPTYEPLRAQNLENYNSDEKILTPALRGDFIFNYWKDANNRRGIWRRTSIDDYIAGDPDWEILLDLDALAEEEGEDWVWKGATCLRPDYRRCLLDLSRGGADATVIREFDVEDQEFVAGGFQVEEAKTIANWVDEDTLYVGSDFGEGSLTDSGYARTSRVWARGEPIEEATEIFSGEQADVVAYVERSWDGDTFFDIAESRPGFFTSQRYLYHEDSDLQLIEIPGDSVFHGVVQGQMIVEIKTDWSIGNNDYAQGSLLAIDFERFMQGDRDFDLLLLPSESSAIVRGGVMPTRDYIIVNQLEDVVSKLTRFEFVDGAWVGMDIESPGLGKIALVTSDDDSNVFFFNYESFLSPDTLYVGNDGGASIETIQSLPEYFDTSGMTVEQHFTTSADGTMIPYFIALPKGFVADGSTPTLMYGYGGFQISRPPSYSSTVGHSWLERGGAYVMANIRGGGEYGPRWHHAAMLENRQRAYDDFIAVAEDLIEREVTSSERLGIRGGSNGGLLTGVMLTQRPDLFKGVVIQVPLLDMKRYHLLLAGASWMAEYGDPDTDDWDFISKYSPYQNLDPEADYPVPFFTTSTRDDRVHPAHARKMVARMNEMGHDLYYYENTVGGHAGASDYDQAAKVEAMIYSYLWDQLGN
ncbi:MAG: S9 family peptidase [Proteobacteria bacterium]|nr:S9 family peptidase [Pseudomonadota bacterium]